VLFVRASLAPVFDELEVLARAGGFDAEETSAKRLAERVMR
jgi:hypothetical protein